MLSKQQRYLYVQADVNALLGWLEKEFDAKGGRPLSRIGPWLGFLI
jgi:hypothetical protein